MPLPVILNPWGIVIGGALLIFIACNARGCSVPRGVDVTWARVLRARPRTRAAACPAGGSLKIRLLPGSQWYPGCSALTANPELKKHAKTIAQSPLSCPQSLSCLQKGGTCVPDGSNAWQEPIVLAWQDVPHPDDLLAAIINLLAPYSGSLSGPVNIPLGVDPTFGACVYLESMLFPCECSVPVPITPASSGTTQPGTSGPGGTTGGSGGSGPLKGGFIIAETRFTQRTCSGVVPVGALPTFCQFRYCAPGFECRAVDERCQCEPIETGGTTPGGNPPDSGTE